MKTAFSIVLNMNTASGFEGFGRFSIGSDRGFAYDLFARLQGSEVVNEEDVLHMDLVETSRGLPVNIRVINCTLDELTANCRTITKEVFKGLNLEDMGRA